MMMVTHQTHAARTGRPKQVTSVLVWFKTTNTVKSETVRCIRDGTKIGVVGDRQQCQLEAADAACTEYVRTRVAVRSSRQLQRAPEPPVLRVRRQPTHQNQPPCAPAPKKKPTTTKKKKKKKPAAKKKPHTRESYHDGIHSVLDGCKDVVTLGELERAVAVRRGIEIDDAKFVSCFDTAFLVGLNKGS